MRRWGRIIGRKEPRDPGDPPDLDRDEEECEHGIRGDCKECTQDALDRRDAAREAAWESRNER